MDILKKSLKGVVVVTILFVSIQPAMAAMYDLTGSGPADQYTINGAIFMNSNSASTGSGVIESFVRIQTNDPVEEGYNTDFRPLEYDENNSPTFTRSLLLSDVPLIDIGGTYYREFLLDINQNKTGDGRLLSVDTIELYQGSAGDLVGHGAGHASNADWLSNTNLVYDLDAGEDNWILLDYSLNSGSGSGDMFAYIRDDLFNNEAREYVYLYSKFGESSEGAYPNTASFEEWAVRDATVIPVPGAVLLGMIGLSVAGVKLRKYA